MSTEIEENCAKVRTFAHFLEKFEGRKGAAVFLFAAAADETAVDAAKMAGISRRTAVNRLADPDWQEAIRSVRAALFTTVANDFTSRLEGIAERLAVLTSKATDVLEKMSEDGESESVKVSAARVILQMALAYDKRLPKEEEDEDGWVARNPRLQRLLDKAEAELEYG